MKALRRVLFYLLLAVLLTIVLAAAFIMRSGDGITVSYSPGLDAICSSLRGPPVKDEWKSELVSRLEEYRGLWNSVGPRMLSTAQTLTGLPQPAAAKVRLTLCNLPSQSLFGISVNMRFAMHSFAGTPVPLRYKVDTQFHELLHRMLDGHVPKASPLLAGHPEASPCTRNHLHLLALQKAVLLELDERAVLSDVVRFDSSLPDECYRAAWGIVNSSESGYLSYVSEIRSWALQQANDDNPSKRQLHAALRSDTDETRSGAVGVAEIGPMRFEVTDFLSRETVRADPASAARAFPSELVAAISKKATE